MRMMNEIRNEFFAKSVISLAFIEAPLVGRGGVRSTLVQAYVNGAVQGMLAEDGWAVHLVPVGTWKKEVVGKGNATKEEVAEWAAARKTGVVTESKNDQDVIDALALCDYGRAVAFRAEEIKEESK